MLIQCRSLTKTYWADGREFKAVDDVNLAVEKHDFVVILGHSGSGKTTLLSLIGGLTRPERGEVYVKGTENWQQSEEDLALLRNKTIGFIFQFGSLIPTLTVLENILLPLTFAKIVAGGRKEALHLLDIMGLADKHNVFPAQLSGGQQRRVAIARAFINRPEIILADEPTGDLDEETEQEILSIFRRYNQQEGVTFLVVTHNSDLAATQMNAKVLRMSNGRLNGEGMA